MDLDFSMLLAFPTEYRKINSAAPKKALLDAILGGSHNNEMQYSLEERKLFATYHKHFKLGSKPAAHIEALSNISDENLLSKMPKSFDRLANAVISKLAELPE